MRRFHLERKEDLTGVSGTGIVAVGVCFPDGKTVMQWQTDLRSMVIYDHPDLIEQIHGHNGSSKLVWND